MFLLDVFEKVALKHDDAVLLLIGDGPDFDEISSRIAQSPNKDRIIVYGESEDMVSLYSAMDVFVFPSKYEGLGIVLLEAQINGLYCIASDAVPLSTRITDNIEYLSLLDPADGWGKRIVEACSLNVERQNVYNKYIEKIRKYDIQETVGSLEEKYEDLLGGGVKHLDLTNKFHTQNDQVCAA